MNQTINEIKEIALSKADKADVCAIIDNMPNRTDLDDVISKAELMHRQLLQSVVLL